jgi:predicted aconitase
MVQEAVPAIGGLKSRPDVIKLKHLGAAAASSGGVEMYHIPGVTPEAPSLEAALGGHVPRAVWRYGHAERRTAYENLNSSAVSREVDFIMLGCPHSTLEQVWRVAQLLEGKRLHGNTRMWLFVARALKEVADRSGYTKTIEAAGAHVLTDTCCAISGTVAQGAKVVATDSAKQAHYLPAMLGVQTWFGTTEDCIAAATSGRWSGGLA